MSTQHRGLRTEKVYRDRKLNEVRDGYVRIAIPFDVVEDERYDIEPGDTVSVTGVIEENDAFLKIEWETED